MARPRAGGHVPHGLDGEHRDEATEGRAALQPVVGDFEFDGGALLTAVREQVGKGRRSMAAGRSCDLDIMRTPERRRCAFCDRRSGGMRTANALQSP